MGGASGGTYRAGGGGPPARDIARSRRPLVSATKCAVRLLGASASVAAVATGSMDVGDSGREEECKDEVDWLEGVRRIVAFGDVATMASSGTYTMSV